MDFYSNTTIHRRSTEERLSCGIMLLILVTSMAGYKHCYKEKLNTDHCWVITVKGLHIIIILLLFLSDTPPSIYTVGKSDPNSVEVEGGSVTLHCQASGDRPVTYTWSAEDLNGNDKDISLNRYSQDGSTGRLTISALRHGVDDGYYHCIAKNAAGGMRSSRILIRVACK